MAGIRLLLFCFLACFINCNAQKEFGNKYLTLQKVIKLPGVRGRIDHLAADAAHQIIYVAALGNNTVEVIDLNTGKVVHSIKGLHEPQGVEYLSFSNSIFVANGGTGICNFFDATTFQPTASLDFKDDADDVRYSFNNKTVYVGYGDGGIGIISEESRKEIGRIALKGHPEGFQVDLKSRKIWVNVPDAHMIEVLDEKNLNVFDQWKINNLNANFPMAYDSLHHRLFIGFRSPSRLVVFDSETGKQIASLPCAGDTDDLFYDAHSKRIILSGGSGYIDIFGQDKENSYSTIAHISSAKGARTSLWIPAKHQFILAVPMRAGQSAELRIYEMN
jgi:YVTN family beta-propeller protein